MTSAVPLLPRHEDHGGERGHKIQGAPQLAVHGFERQKRIKESDGPMPTVSQHLGWRPGAGWLQQRWQAVVGMAGLRRKWFCELKVSSTDTQPVLNRFFYIEEPLSPATSTHHRTPSTSNQREFPWTGAVATNVKWGISPSMVSPKSSFRSRAGSYYTSIFLTLDPSTHTRLHRGGRVDWAVARYIGTTPHRRPYPG